MYYQWLMLYLLVCSYHIAVDIETREWMPEVKTDFQCYGFHMRNIKNNNTRERERERERKKCSWLDLFIQKKKKVAFRPEPNLVGNFEKYTKKCLEPKVSMRKWQNVLYIFLKLSDWISLLVFLWSSFYLRRVMLVAMEILERKKHT